jgi:uncharacterized protein YlaI
MTKHEKEIGYELCKECESGIHLKESGFEVSTHMCSQCKCFVANKDEFFNVNLDVQILSK